MTIHHKETHMARPSEMYNIQLPYPDNVDLPIVGPAHRRPSAELLAKLNEVSSATASATLHRMGIRQTYMHSPVPRTPGAKVVGPAVTLQFMPQREDIASGAGQESVEKVSALWAVFDAVERGDVLVIQAWGDAYTGCMGDMLTTYFKGRGGAGVVVDGSVRDWPKIQHLGVPFWTKGVTPNYASQATLFPWAYNVPVACDRVLVMPGDIIIADAHPARLVTNKNAEKMCAPTRAQ